MFNLKASDKMENINKNRKVNNILITVIIIIAVIINIVTYSLFYNTINLFYDIWAFLAFVAGGIGNIFSKHNNIAYYFAFIFLITSLFIFYISYSTK